MLEDFFEKFDKVTVAHLTDCQKVFEGPAFVPEFTPESILKEYKIAMVSKMLPEQYEVIFEEKDQSMNNPKKQLAILANKVGGSYVFMGSIGRKGEK